MKKAKKLVVLMIMVLSISPLLVNAKAENVNKKNSKETIIDSLLTLEENIITINDDFTKIDERKSQYDFEFKTNDNKYVIIKQAKQMIIWTEKEIKEEDKIEFLYDLKLANKDNSLKLSYFENPIFIYGDGEFNLTSINNNLGVYKFEIIDNKVTLYCDIDKISHANYGTYINKHDEQIEEKEEYEWVEVYREHTDSATGFGLDNYKVSNSWFIGQKLNFANVNLIKLDIQAGNPFKGNTDEISETNFVGEISLIKNGEEYIINYENLDSLPETEKYNEGDRITIRELDSPKYIVSTEKISVSNQGKDLIPFKNGDTFVMEQLEFDFYAHFNVYSVTYELIKK
ncbi:MAG: hypothetical protein PUC23_05180 [bacterium]|nr:hypothetical protein [bacterium]